MSLQICFCFCLTCVALIDLEGCVSHLLLTFHCLHAFGDLVNITIFKANKTSPSLIAFLCKVAGATSWPFMSSGLLSAPRFSFSIHRLPFLYAKEMSSRINNQSIFPLLFSLLSHSSLNPFIFYECPFEVQQIQIHRGRATSSRNCHFNCIFFLIFGLTIIFIFSPKSWYILSIMHIP